MKNTKALFNFHILVWMCLFIFNSQNSAAEEIRPLHYVTESKSLPDSNTDGICDDCADDAAYASYDKVYVSLVKALEEVQCGETLIVAPGEYPYQIGFQPESSDTDSWYGVGNKECSIGNELVIKAEFPVVMDYNPNKKGAAPLQYCTQEKDSCDTRKASMIWSLSSWKSVTNSSIHLIGFVFNEVRFTPTNDDYNNPEYFGCRDCVIKQNYFFKNYRECLVFYSSDNVEIAGNQIYACGGIDSGTGVAVKAIYAPSYIHHNHLFGTGQDNGTGATIPLDQCTSSNWRNDECWEGFSGADGMSFHNAARLGGTRIFRNICHGLRPNYLEAQNDTGSDGDCVDGKASDSAVNDLTNPVWIVENEFYDLYSIVFHRGFSGVVFARNHIHHMLSNGITWMAGQECQEGQVENGSMKDYLVFGNIIHDVTYGMQFKHLGEGTCAEDQKRSIYNIHVFNNLIFQSEIGLVITWLTDNDCSDGSCSYEQEAADTALTLANNLVSDSTQYDVHIQDRQLDHIAFLYNSVKTNPYVVATNGEANYNLEDSFGDESYVEDPMISMNETGLPEISPDSPAWDSGLRWSLFLESDLLTLIRPYTPRSDLSHANRGPFDLLSHGY